MPAVAEKRIAETRATPSATILMRTKGNIDVETKDLSDAKTGRTVGNGAVRLPLHYLNKAAHPQILQQKAEIPPLTVIFFM